MKTDSKQSAQKSPFLNGVPAILAIRRFSPKTQKSYLYWIKYFILYNGKRYPKELGKTEISSFLSYLAVQRNVSASTQNQALSALVFLRKYVLGKDIGNLGQVAWA